MCDGTSLITCIRMGHRTGKKTGGGDRRGKEGIKRWMQALALAAVLMAYPVIFCMGEQGNRGSGAGKESK